MLSWCVSVLTSSGFHAQGSARPTHVVPDVRRICVFILKQKDRDIPIARCVVDLSAPCLVLEKDVPIYSAAAQLGGAGTLAVAWHELGDWPNERPTVDVVPTAWPAKVAREGQATRGSANYMAVAIDGLCATHDCLEMVASFLLGRSGGRNKTLCKTRAC
jgi:hypothetical protein